VLSSLVRHPWQRCRTKERSDERTTRTNDDRRRGLRARGGRVRGNAPYGSLDQILVTEDTTPLEPQILEHKFYAPGIGVVMERVLRGGQEVSRLVSYTPPS
jgi:hypothetical protein